MAAQSPNPLQPGQRPPDHLSATDEDRPTLELQNVLALNTPLEVFTTSGPQPFFPPEPAPPSSDELNPFDNPFNPKGQPSLSLPQQATPLTSEQGTLSTEEMADHQAYLQIAATQDGLAPDDPRNPRGTPDYITTEPEAVDGEE